MKLSISYPQMARTKKFLIEDEQKMKALWDLRIAEEFKGDVLGEPFKGFVFKITGGSDKQGFAMMQGVLTAERVRLLLGPDHACYNLHPRQKRDDTRKRKSIRGCITSIESAVLNLVIVKKGDKDIPGLTDEGSAIPNRLGPRRATKIRKLWNLEKKEDVRQYVIRRKIPLKKDPTKFRTVVPRVQRLITPKHRARRAKNLRERKIAKQRTEEAKAEYEKRIAAKREATRSKRLSKLSKKRAAEPKKADKKVETKKVEAKKVEPKKVEAKKAPAKAAAKPAAKAAAKPAAKAAGKGGKKAGKK